MDIKIGDNLLRARNAAGLTQKELAALAEIGQSRVSAFELDKALPTLEQFVAIARVTKASYDELLNGALPVSPATDAERAAIAIIRDQRMPLIEVINRLKFDPGAPHAEK